MKGVTATYIAVIILAAWFGCSGEPSADNTYDPNNDRVRPAVLSISPVNNQVAVSVHDKITATLSEDIDTLSITSDNVVILDGSHNIVAGVISYSGRKITITPVEKMNNCQEYTVVLTDRIRDLAGNTLASDYIIVFTTEASFTPQMIRVPKDVSIDPPPAPASVTFTMGSSVIAGMSIPEHQVTVDAFYIGKTEVTFDQFDEFCVATGREKPLANFDRGFMPVINVSWYDAVDFCNWLSRINGLEECYERDGPVVIWQASRNGYRLPTEAEWECAAREAGVTDASGYSGYWSGVTDVNDYAWHALNSDGITHEAATLNPNLLGIHDMSGNVAEWCWDWYDSNYYQYCLDNGPMVNPRGAAATSDYHKILRGGSWDSAESGSGIAAGMRDYEDAIYKSTTAGFRVCKNE